MSESNRDRTKEINRYLRLLESLPMAFLLEDENRKILKTNKNMCDMFSIPVGPGDMIGVDCSNSAEEAKAMFEDPEAFLKRITQVFTGRKEVRGDILKTVDGRCLSRDYIPILLEDEIAGHVWLYKDVSSEILEQERLKKEQFRLQEFVNSVPVPMAMFDSSMRYVAFSSRWVEEYGLQGYELIGRSHYEIFPDIPQRWKDEHAKCLRGHYLTNPDDTFERAGGESISLRWALSPWYDSPGSVGGLIMMTESNEYLQKIRESAAEASRLKSLFVASMSHELRTPLNGVIGLSKLLASTELTSEQSEIVKNISVASDSLILIINDILDYSKIEAGKLEVEVEPFDLNSCVEDLMSLFRHSSEEKQIVLQLDNKLKDRLLLNSDEKRFKQILMNLVSNSIKFTKRGVVKLSVIREQRNIKFVVRDTGVGIEKSFLDKLFLPFHQADKSVSRKFGGTGLGLSISKQLAHMLGAEISVKSELGLGSEFSVSMPLSMFVSAEKICLFKDGRESEMSDRVAGLANVRVLVAEDNPVNQLLIKKLISPHIQDIDYVDNGCAAYKHAAKNVYDLILMDVQMPGVSGLDAAIKIRMNQAIRQPLIVTVTANAFAEERLECLEAGMDAVISKPINFDEFFKVISNLLREHSGDVGAKNLKRLA